MVERHFALDESSDIEAIMYRVWLWLRKHDDAEGWPRCQAAQSLAAMVRLYSPPIVAFFASQLDHANRNELRWMSTILRHAPHNFVFEQSAFVVRYLERCRSVEGELARNAISELFAASISGSWWSTPGEPAPRDIEARDSAEAMLNSLSRLSPAYKLYKDLWGNAKNNIKIDCRRRGVGVNDLPTRPRAAAPREGSF